MGEGDSIVSKGLLTFFPISYLYKLVGEGFPQNLVSVEKVHPSCYKSMVNADCISEPLSAFSEVTSNIIQNPLPIPKVNQSPLIAVLCIKEIPHAELF